LRTLYRPGSSVLHRLPVGTKLVAFTLTVVLISITAKTAFNVAVSASLVLILYLLAGMADIQLLRLLWKMRALLVIVLLPQLIFNGVVQGALNTVAVIAGILLAGLLSFTTKTTEVISFIEKVTRSRSLALLIAMSMNAIALVDGFAKQITEAAKARGKKRKPLRQIINLFVQSLRFADDQSEALRARGIEV